MNRHRSNWSVMGAGVAPIDEPPTPWRQWHDKTKTELEKIINSAYGINKSEQVSEVVKIIREIIDEEEAIHGLSQNCI